MSKVIGRHVEMQATDATTFKQTTKETEPSTSTSSINPSNSTVTDSPSPTTSTPSFWDENSTTIIIVICIAIVLLILLVILMALFVKWKEKRRTEGNYNPSRAEKYENQKNKVVFSIPLPTPERLI